MQMDKKQPNAFDKKNERLSFYIFVIHLFYGYAPMVLGVASSSGIMFKVLMYTTFFEKKFKKPFQGFNKTQPSKKFNCEKIFLFQVWIQVSLAQVLKFEM